MKNNLEDMLKRQGGSTRSGTGVSGLTKTASKFRLAKSTTGTTKTPLGGFRQAAAGAIFQAPPSPPQSDTPNPVLRRVSSNAQLFTPPPAAGSPFAGSSKAGSIPEGNAGNQSVMRDPGVVTRPVSAQQNALEALSIQAIQARIIKNQDERINLIMKRASLTQEDLDMGEDPDMMDEKLAMLSTRLDQLKAVLDSKVKASSGISTPPPPPLSSGSTLASRSMPVPAQSLYPTPDTTAGPSRIRAGPSPGTWDHQRPKGLSSDIEESDSNPRRVLGDVQVLASDDEPALPPPRAGPSARKKRIPTPPPEIDEMDIAMAEGDDEFTDDQPQPETVPDSSPPARLQTPPPIKARTKSSNKAQALAEIQDIPPDALFSPPPLSRQNPITPRQGEASSSARPIRAEASVSRSVQAPRPVRVEVRHPWSKEVDTKLRQVFKLPGFRTHQKEVIDETMAGKDVFVLMPTGGGKSLTYQLPSICGKGATKGVTFVVSPLISLINDQTRHLIKLGIPAIAYTGDMTAADKNAANQQLNEEDPWTKVCYVTPEMLSMGGAIKGIMRGLVRRKRLARFVIDEAHCVSQWGHDFRSDYLKLGDLRKEYPGVPIMALTATAQNRVEEDILRVLDIKGCRILRQSFNRPNLHYEVRPKMGKVTDNMVNFIQNEQKGASGIIYCASRDKCEDLAKELREKKGLPAHHYHAGMSKGDRRKIQEGWQDRKFDIIVATVAFGMGIDKPDVRFVIHHSLPRSLEGYYQETGRAGRDGEPSVCVLYYTFGDSSKVSRMIDMDTNLTRDQKDRQKAAMNEVTRYCDNKTDCRRVQVLSFFGEKFDPVNCHNGCDTCLTLDKHKQVEEDVTEDACKMLELVKEFGREEHVTLVMLVECFRGMNSKKDYIGANPHFGIGKDWERQEATRLAETLLREGGLKSYAVTNGAGYFTSYVTVGDKCRDFTSKKRKLLMHFRQKSPRKAAANKGKGRKTKATGPLDGFAQKTVGPNFISNPISRKRSLQQIEAEVQEFDTSPWGDTDDEGDFIPSDEDGVGGGEGDGGDSPIEISDDDVPLAKSAVAKRRKVLEVGKGKAKGKGQVMEDGDIMSALKPRARIDQVKGVDRADSASPVEQCFRHLKALKQTIIKRDKNAPALAEETLQMVAATMPQNLPALRDVEGITSAHMKAFGEKILNICIKYKPFSALDAAEYEKAAASSRDGPPAVARAETSIKSIQSYAYQPPTSGPSRSTSTMTASKTGFTIAKGGAGRPRF